MPCNSLLPQNPQISKHKQLIQDNKDQANKLLLSMLASIDAVESNKEKQVAYITTGKIYYG